MKPLIFHPEADEEVIDAAQWYDGKNPGLGTEFLDEIDAAISRVSDAPEAYGILRHDIRCHRLHRFPHGMMYRVESGRVFVLAVMHLHRDPECWKDRM